MYWLLDQDKSPYIYIINNDKYNNLNNQVKSSNLDNMSKSAFIIFGLFRTLINIVM